MRVGAVVPALDEAARIGAVVERLRALGAEVVVADGGSRDGTPDRAVAAGARVVQSPPGRAVQMNVGARHASGDVLWFVHADARPADGALAAIERALADPTVVGGAFTTRTVADRPTRLRPVLPLADLRSHYTRLPYGDQALFVRREAFERVGGYPPLPIFEDVELARRLWAVGKLVRLRERVEVSARRYLAHPLRTSAVMNAFPALYAAGVDVDRLARWYRAERMR